MSAQGVIAPFLSHKHPPTAEAGRRADHIVEALDAAGFVIVPKLVRGETPGKVAAWQAFLKHMGSEMPRNPDGTYNGSFDVAMQAAIDAYLTASQEPKP